MSIANDIVDKLQSTAFYLNKPLSVVATTILRDAMTDASYDKYLAAWLRAGSPRRSHYKDPLRAAVVPQ